MNQDHTAAPLSAERLDNLPTYDPDRDTPGIMELRDKYKDGDYFKVEDVRALIAQATVDTQVDTTAPQPVGEQALPPLPVAAIGNNPYTADQMRAYARAALDMRASSAPADILREALALCDLLVNSADRAARSASADLRPKIERAMLASPTATPSSAAPAAQAVEALTDDLAWHKEALAAVRGKLAAVWDGIREAVEKYSGVPCDGEPFDRLDELLSRLSGSQAQQAAPAYGPNNPPRLRKAGESVEDYRFAMGWDTAAAAAPAEDAKDAARLDYIEANSVRGATYQGITSVNVIVHEDDIAMGGVRYAIDCMRERKDAMSSTQHSAKAGGEA